MMKYLILTIVLLSLFLVSSCQNNIIAGCTAEAKICPDGSAVGRSGINCEFEKCPDLINCGPDNSPCPENYQCYIIKDNYYCLTGDTSTICSTVCNNPTCQFIETDPMQIECEN